MQRAILVSLVVCAAACGPLSLSRTDAGASPTGGGAFGVTGGGVATGAGGGGAATGGGADSGLWPSTAANPDDWPLEELLHGTAVGLRALAIRGNELFFAQRSSGVLTRLQLLADGGFSSSSPASVSGDIVDLGPSVDGGLLVLGRASTQSCGGSCDTQATFTEGTVPAPPMALRRLCSGQPSSLAIASDGTEGALFFYDGGAWVKVAGTSALINRVSPAYGLGPQACHVLPSGEVLIAGEDLHRFNKGVFTKETASGFPDFGVPLAPAWADLAESPLGVFVVGSRHTIARRVGTSWQVVGEALSAGDYRKVTALPDAGLLIVGQGGRTLVSQAQLTTIATPAQFEGYGVAIDAWGRLWVAGHRPGVVGELWRSP